jgi:uncharacterized protein YutE (UPF0331/DUF86 family)
MDKRKFTATVTNIGSNIELINDILKSGDDSLLAHPKRIERAKYFFASATQSLLNLCNDYIDSQDWRGPINAMDVFIVLAENDIISKEAVPGLKKAVMSIGALTRAGNAEALSIMRECMRGLEHCVSAYKVLIQTGEL